MVLAFVILDLIMLVTYTVASGDELSAKYVINAENPKDVKGVSSFNITTCGKYKHSVNFISLEKHLSAQQLRLCTVVNHTLEL